jgi:hypothetical protein
MPTTATPSVAPTYATTCVCVRARACVCVCTVHRTRVHVCLHGACVCVRARPQLLVVGDISSARTSFAVNVTH